MWSIYNEVVKARKGELTMILSLALIASVALGGIPAWALFLLFLTWIPDVVFMGLVSGR